MFNAVGMALSTPDRLFSRDSWYVDQGLWSFRVTTPSEFFDRSLGVHARGSRAADRLPGSRVPSRRRALQPRSGRELAAALGDRVTLRSFTAAESAAYHCISELFSLMNGAVLDWCTEVLNAPQASLRGDGNRARHQQPQAEDMLR